MPEPRKTPDWELAERLYRAGQLTLRQVAEQVGCAHQVLSRRAKAKGWERDLTPRIRETVRARVSNSGAKPIGAKEGAKGDNKAPVSDAEIVEGQVAAVLLVFSSHDTRRGKIKAQLDKRLDELDGMGKDSTLDVIDGLKKAAETALKVELAERDALGFGTHGSMTDQLKALKELPVGGQ